MANTRISIVISPPIIRTLRKRRVHPTGGSDFRRRPGQFSTDGNTGTLFSAPVYKTYGGLITERAFTPPGFALPLGLKDNRLLLRAAEDLRVPLPLASVIRDQILAALARGREGQDWSSFAMVAAENAGLGDDGRG